MAYNKIDVIEISAVVLSLIFAIVISMYHMSFNGFEGLSSSQWDTVWAIAENSLSLVMATLVSIFAGKGIIRTMFNWVFIPYFIIKLIYHYSIFSQVYILPKQSWENIWSFICVFLLGTGLFYCINSIKKIKKNAFKIF
jgi:hypothetical protein